MIVVRNLESTEQISDPAIMTLVQQRIQGLSEQGFELEEVGHFVVADSTDTLVTIERHLGVPIGAYEIAEQYPSCFDLVYVLDAPTDPRKVRRQVRQAGQPEPRN